MTPVAFPAFSDHQKRLKIPTDRGHKSRTFRGCGSPFPIPQTGYPGMACMQEDRPDRREYTGFAIDYPDVGVP